MSHPIIEVDLAELRRLAARLQTIHDRLGDWDHRRPEFTATGDPEVITALEDFYDHWDCGFAEVRKLLERTVSSLQAAVEIYHGSDSQVARRTRELLSGDAT